MERKRKNISARVRWNVFQRDDFRCVYCGAAKKDGAVLVVDHGDPFSRGGADDESNYVTACKPCNDGKKAKIVIPAAADVGNHHGCVTRRGVAYKNQLHADWADAFRQACYEVKYLAMDDDLDGLFRIDACNGVDGLHQHDFDVFRVDFWCDFLDEGVGKVNVVIADNCDPGCFSVEDKRRIRNAAILGYREPTAIIIGSPWFYYAAVVNERYKGVPAGFKLNEHLADGGEFLSSGWYPDENWDFADPREDFGLRPNCFEGRGWHLTAGDIADELSDMGAIYGRGSQYGL